MTYEEVSEALRTHPQAYYGTGANEEEIARAESALQVLLPEAYRRFLREFGWGGVESQLFGLGPDVPPELYLVRRALDERTEFYPLTPHHLLPILDDGGGNLFCLDTQRVSGGDCPVVFQDHELDEISDYADSFLDWTYQEVQQALGS